MGKVYIGVTAVGGYKLWGGRVSGRGEFSHYNKRGETGLSSTYFI